MSFKSLDETMEEDWIQEHAASFDAVLSIASPEKHRKPTAVLSVWRKLLKPNGKLLLCVESLGNDVICDMRLVGGNGDEVFVIPSFSR